MNTLILYDTLYGHNFELGNFIYQTILPSASVPRLVYYIAGVGDKNFGPAKFANAVNIFDRQLRQHCASPLASSLKIDYEDLPTAQQTVTDEITNFLRKGRDSNY